jgi:transcriptional regulator with XRE-family HTH domain
MGGVKRPRARIEGARLADAAAERAGRDVAASRRRRHWTQQALSDRVGISRSREADIEAGRGANVPLEVWFALGEALDRPFRAGFVRDSLEETADAGHLPLQELVLRLGRQAGYEGGFELATRPADPARSVDAPLIDRRRRRLIINECWNSFGDLGAAARSSNRKLAEAAALAAALGGDDGPPYAVSLCWVVRDTRRNRELIERYPHIFESRFPGSLSAWVRALTAGGPLPAEPGLVWCDVNATRLYARRRRNRAGAR